MSLRGALRDMRDARCAPPSFIKRIHFSPSHLALILSSTVIFNMPSRTNNNKKKRGGRSNGFANSLVHYDVDLNAHACNGCGKTFAKQSNGGFQSSRIAEHVLLKCSGTYSNETLKKVLAGHSSKL